jgi:hypothetical protein
MKLVRFGDTVINMDRVNYIELVPSEENGVARLYFSAPFTPNGIESLTADYVKLYGADVDTLELWLADNDNCE